MTIRSEPLVAPRSSFTGADGSTELAELRGRAGEQMLVLVHQPSAPPTGAAVICSPLFAEFMRNYRREVLLARELARLGYVVERFHYRFSGNSDGEDEDLTFDSMREDALACVADARERCPGGPLVLIGARLGALVAASVAGEHPNAAVVLWEPMLEITRYFKEAFRARLVKERRDGDEQAPTGRQLEEVLRGGEPVEVPGHLIFPALHASAAGRTLESELGPDRRRLLAVQVGPTGTIRAELARQVERWRAGGLGVDATAVKGEESWWLVDERWHDEARRPMTKELLALTTAWVEGLGTDDTEEGSR
jgi:alpha/beta superfamily hydrolase